MLYLMVLILVIMFAPVLLLIPFLCIAGVIVVVFISSVMDALYETCLIGGHSPTRSTSQELCDFDRTIRTYEEVSCRKCNKMLEKKKLINVRGRS